MTLKQWQKIHPDTIKATMSFNFRLDSENNRRKAFQISRVGFENYTLLEHQFNAKSITCYYSKSAANEMP